MTVLWREILERHRYESSYVGSALLRYAISEVVTDLTRPGAEILAQAGDSFTLSLRFSGKAAIAELRRNKRKRRKI